MINGQAPAAGRSCPAGRGGCLSLPPRPVDDRPQRDRRRDRDGRRSVRHRRRSPCREAVAPRSCSRRSRRMPDAAVQIWARTQDRRVSIPDEPQGRQLGVVRYYTPPITAWTAYPGAVRRRLRQRSRRQRRSGRDGSLSRGRWDGRFGGARHNGRRAEAARGAGTPDSPPTAAPRTRACPRRRCRATAAAGRQATDEDERQQQRRREREERGRARRSGRPGSPARIPPTGKMPQNPISKIDSTRPRIRGGASAWSSAIVVVRKMISTQATVPTSSIDTGSECDRPIDRERQRRRRRPSATIVRPRPSRRPDGFHRERARRRSRRPVAGREQARGRRRRHASRSRVTIVRIEM